MISGENRFGQSWHVPITVLIVSLIHHIVAVFLTFKSVVKILLYFHSMNESSLAERLRGII